MRAVYVVMLVAGCSAARAGDAEVGTVRAFAPVSIELTLAGEPCVTWVIGPDPVTVDTSCCPPGYTPAGLGDGGASLVCVVLP